MRRARVLVMLFAIMCTGCAAPVVSFQLNDEIRMDVYDAKADAETFEVRVKFVESSAYPEVIQEGRWHEHGWTFVETFAADDVTVVDSHSGYGFGAHTEGVRRSCVVYCGQTEGADWSGRFAMLPQNFDGSVTTNAPHDRFNVRYWVRHRAQGRVVVQSRQRGTWHLTWKPYMLMIRVGDERCTWLFDPRHP